MAHQLSSGSASDQQSAATTGGGGGSGGSGGAGSGGGGGGNTAGAQVASKTYMVSIVRAVPLHVVAAGKQQPLRATLISMQSPMASHAALHSSSERPQKRHPEFDSRQLPAGMLSTAPDCWL